MDTEETAFGATGRHRSSCCHGRIIPAAQSRDFLGRAKGVPMTEHPGLSPDHRRVERAIVLQLLRDDHDTQWSRTDLQARLNDVEPAALAHALKRLERQGVVLVRAADAIMASPCARHLDALGLIGI
jgi:hypothetical protein